MPMPYGMVVERSDGRLISFNRLSGSFLVGESSDRGRTWTTQQPNDIPHPAARFVFMKLRAGNWLLVKHGSIRLSIFVADGGRFVKRIVRRSNCAS
jgi:hypothetical protein